VQHGRRPGRARLRRWKLRRRPRGGDAGPRRTVRGGAFGLRPAGARERRRGGQW
jgi:hypothetical protein